MKSIYKKISVGLVALAFVAVAGYGVKNSMSNDVQLSDLAKANIEALANTESEGSCHGGGVANLQCPIWNITYEQGWGMPTVSCSTGGSWKCKAGTCPHGN